MLAHLPRTTEIPVGQRNFTVDLCGPDDGPPVLLLHGFPQSRYAWRHTLRTLAGAGHRGIAPDQRGYSPGARPADHDAYALAHLLDDALRLLDALGVARAHLVGHDWGGHLAWNLAARHPERFRSVAVLSRPHPAAFVGALARDPQQAQRSGHHRTLLEPEAPARMRAGDFAGMRAMLAGHGVPADAIDAYVRTLRPEGALEAAIAWYRAGAATFRDPALPPIRMPALYAWGDADHTVGRMAAETTPAAVGPQCRFVMVPGAGHFLTDQVPEVVNRELLAHLRAAGDAG